MQLLAEIQHSPDVRVRIVESRDASRISIQILSQTGRGWQLAGAVPSFPGTVMATVQDALARAQEAVQRRV